MQVNIHEAKTHLSRLVARAAAGEEIIIARGGRPVARLTSLLAARETRRLGKFRGEIRMEPDFDDLPPDIQAVFDGDGAGNGDVIEAGEHGSRGAVQIEGDEA